MDSILNVTIQIGNHPNALVFFLQTGLFSNVTALIAYHPNVTADIGYRQNITAVFLQMNYVHNVIVLIAYSRNFIVEAAYHPNVTAQIVHHPEVKLQNAIIVTYPGRHPLYPNIVWHQI